MHVKWIAIFMLVGLVLPTFASAETVVDETVAVDPIVSTSLGMKAYGFEVLDDGGTITISVDVLTENEEISIFIADDAETTKALSGDSFEYYLMKESIVSGTYEVELGPADTYWIILFNDNLLGDVTVAVTIDYQSPGSGLFYLLLLAVAVIAFVLWRRSKNKAPVAA